MITENERLRAAIEQLADDFEARVKSALSALDEAAERAEKLARRLEELSAAGSARTGGPQARNTAALGEKHKDVVALAKQGMSIESIAKQVELGTGEVELVLNIHREGQSPLTDTVPEEKRNSGKPKERNPAI